MVQHPFKSWIEIRRSAVAANIALLRSKLEPATRLFAAVKSNAYGHGLVLFSKLLDELGVDGFCVDSVIEGKKLRKEGIIKPILVLGPTFPNLLADAEKENITITISSFDGLTEYENSAAKPEVHIKIDTGMHRQGFLPDDIPALLVRLAQSAFREKVKGVYTHFAVAKDANNMGFIQKQFKAFDAVRTLFIRSGFTNCLFHAAKTGGMLLSKEFHLDAIRPGIGLYGITPSHELLQQGYSKELVPVLSWYCLVSEVKKIAEGETIGYDCTYQVKRETQLAVIPIGYWHGIPWRLSNTGFVAIRGMRAPILGRVCMDLLMVDVTDIPGVRRGDVVTLIGEGVPATLLAEKAGTSPYELLTRINPLIHRVVV